MKKNNILYILLGLLIGNFYSNKTRNRYIKEKDSCINKYIDYYIMLNQWIINLHNNKYIYEYFINNNYKNIAIYDMGELGIRLYEELKNCKDIEIRYAIDKNNNITFKKIKIFSTEDKLPDVDIIIITDLFLYDIIKKQLSLKTNALIISLEDVIYNI